jgi:hypothetical protein
MIESETQSIRSHPSLESERFLAHQNCKQQREAIMNSIDSQDLSERVQKYVQRQKAFMRWGFFVSHVFLFAISLFIGIGTFSETYWADIPEPLQTVMIFPLVLWFIALMFHLGSTLAGGGILDRQLAAQGVTKELGKQFIEQQLGMIGDKPKRDTSHLDADYVTINEEGELVPDGEHHHAHRSSSTAS